MPADTDRIITLSTADLLSEHGFHDGSILDDVLYELEDTEGLDPKALDPAVLIRVVREIVLPAVHQNVVVVDEPGTSANPIRAVSVNGKPVSAGLRNIRLTPSTVDIPVATIKQIARQVARRR